MLIINRYTLYIFFLGLLVAFSASSSLQQTEESQKGAKKWYFNPNALVNKLLNKHSPPVRRPGPDGHTLRVANADQYQFARRAGLAGRTLHLDNADQYQFARRAGPAGRTLHVYNDDGEER
jgi:hypothetical protein